MRSTALSLALGCLASAPPSSSAFMSPWASPVAAHRTMHMVASSSDILSAVESPSSPVSQSAPMSAEEFESVVQRTYGRYPLTIVGGKGCRLTDSGGNEYLDCVAGISTCVLGHAHEGLTEAVTRQMGEMHHISNLYYIPQQGKLAKWLVENSPADKAFFCNSGAEANEAAIKLARKHAHTKLGIDRPVIITALQSFHGRTLAAITATGQPKYQQDFGPLPQGFKYVTYNDVEELKKVVKRINRRGALRGMLGLGKTGVAAIMMEALQGEGGIVPATKEYFHAVRDICDETGALMMCDEVQVGMGRTGTTWGFQQLEVSPDVITAAKALGGGVPIGAMLCTARADVFGPGDHASTFGGNPLACAAALEVTSQLQGGLMANCKARGDQLQDGLQKLVAQHPDVLDTVRGWGLIVGLVLKEETPLTAAQVVQGAVEEGLLLVPAGLKVVVRFVPPLIITEAEVDEALEKMGKAILVAKGRN
ncbi:unnamed protein product [Chrysoparadoxa australica]